MVTTDSRGLKSGVSRALLLGVPAIMLGLPLQNWWAFAHLVPQGYGDFRIFYGAGYVLRTGQRALLYDYQTQKLAQDAHIAAQSIALPFNHLAFESVFFVPFTLVSYSWAWLAFLAVNVMLLFLCYRLLWQSVPTLSAAYPWASAILFFSYVPVAAALMQGQDSIILLALVIAAFTDRENGHHFRSGIWLGCGLFKFQIVLPIAALFFLWREWKLVRGFLVSSVIVSTASLLIVGVSGMKLYLRLLMSNSQQAAQFANGVYPDAMPNLRGLAYGWGLPPSFVLVASALVILLAWRLQPSFDVAIVAALLVSYHLLIHDTSLLLPAALRSLDRGRWYGWLLLLSPLLYVYPAVFYLASLMLAAYLIFQRREQLPSFATSQLL